MCRKKILIVYPGNLYPITMANQGRVIEMAKRFSKDHDVDVISLVRTNSDKDLALEKSGVICNQMIPLMGINSYNNPFKITFHALKFRLLNYFKSISSRKYYWSHPKIVNKIKDIIVRNNYDIVQVEYFYQASIFKLSELKNTYKVIDTHNIMYEKKKLGFEHTCKKAIPKHKSQELRKYKKDELTILQEADLLISISEQDNKTFQKILPQIKRMLMYTGQDLEYFNNYPLNTEYRRVLFYGGMGSEQNIDAFFRYWNEILPLVKKKIPDVKTIVVGSNPPNSIKSLNDGNEVIISGYVEDVREYLAKSDVMILPLKLGGGFRSRVIEVMAMGIPVVGTHNGLDSIGLQHGEQGFVTDSIEEMAHYVVRIISDQSLRTRMSDLCVKFTYDNFSLERTYGTLSSYYSEL